MVDFGTVLSRFSSGWSELIGLPAWNAIRYRKDYQDDVKKIIEYVLDVSGHGASILSDKKTRSMILWKLTESEATELSDRLRLKNDVPLYKRLVEASYTGTKQKVLFDYFSVPLPERNRVVTLPDVESIEPSYGLYDYQKKIILKAMSLYRADQSSRFMIHMPTGSGKTRVAMSLISRVLMESKKSIVLWLAYSEELCEQAVSEFKNSWSAIGDREISVERLFTTHKYVDIDDGLIVAGLGKLWAKSRSDPSFISHTAKKISMVVFDEAHQSVAPTYLSMLNEIKLFNPNCCFVGLSATPGRISISESGTLAQFFDNRKITLSVDGYDSPIRYLYEKKFLSTPRFTMFEFESDVLYEFGEHHLDYSDRILKTLGDDWERNLIIVDQTIKCVNDGHRRIILFAASVDSANYISSMLNLEGIKSLLITSKTSSDLRSTLINKFKSDSDEAMVLCNYGVLTTGFDAPKTTAAIIARPTKSLVLYSQMVGRALRGTAMGGTDTADILVLVDLNLPGSDSVINSFRQWTDEYGWNEQ